MLALILAWKTLQVLFLPKEVTLLGLVSAVWLTVVTPDVPSQIELEDIVPSGELDKEGPAETNECYQKLWGTYRFRLARYQLIHGKVPYVTAAMRKDGEILFVFLNDREDSPKLRTRRAIDKLWLGAFSVHPATGECSAYESIHGEKEKVAPESWKIAWIELLQRVNSKKSS